MKKIRLALAALFLLSLSAPLHAAAFEDANAAYQSGDFKTAVKLYENALAGRKSAAAYFNLGNAYFRQGQKARAVLNFERARALAPRDKDINWNLNLVKSVLADQVESPNDALFIFWLKKIADFFTLDELAALFSLGFVKLFLVCLLSYFFLKLKGLWRFLMVLCAVYIAAAAILLSFKWAEVKDPRVVITDKEVYARFGPSNTETKAFMLHEGAQAVISDESKFWYYVRYSNASSGWIPKTACEVI